ncbi:MAG: peptidyl-prolyl cis-trans isomerase [Myxococcales bacterium]|nr:peptidyl-prolyl cis-trans isomerase [Myxococcales bacterium]
MPARTLRHEPLVHFAVIGGMLFGLHAVCSPAARDPLLVDAARVAAADAALARNLGRPPTADESVAAVRAEVADERLYREALALGLDEDDPIVRRRMIQKLRFVHEDLALAEQPADADLLALRDAHPERYAVPERLALTHVLAARARHDDPRAAAEVLLARLQAGEDPAGLGDPCVHGQRFGPRTLPAYAAMFGEDFAAGLPDMSEGAWSITASPLGAHVVRVDAREAAYLPDLTTLRPRLRADWQTELREAAAREAAADLRERYPARLSDLPPNLAAALAETEL